MNEHLPRKLAVVLYADVVGYSRLTQVDEDATHRFLNDGLNLFTELLRENGGRKINEAGDAVLAEFDSSISAVQCAASFQLEMKDRNSHLTSDQKLEFRIGINIGEVIRDRSNIYGDGVNTTARIQDLAEPGGICISSIVFEQVQRSVNLHFDDIGYKTVKNLSQPIHVYRVRLSDSGSVLDESPRPFFSMPAKKQYLYEGGCWCGEVRFQISAQSMDTNFCHCRMCQKFSGAPVIAGTTFPRDAVRIVKGEPRFFQTSPIAERGFCSACGSSLFYRGLFPEWSNWILVFTASLDNPEDFAPTWHLGVESRMPWLDVQDELPRVRCEESPDLVRAWESVGVQITKPPESINNGENNED